MISDLVVIPLEEAAHVVAEHDERYLYRMSEDAPQAKQPATGSGCIGCIVVIVLVAVVAVVGAIMAGASGSRDSSVVTGGQNGTTDAAFVDQLRSRYSQFESMSDQQIVSQAKSYCTRIENGQSPTTAMTALLVEASQSEYPSEISYFIGAAVAVYCPEYGAELSAITG
ncbi:DUF732 domain-containing protein [Agromyces mariniharenae]|uniref:DUF732 domain-containing protein n=1 Tax=Agromyces mariniharenae TaxID=2604423 RepID=A0A5S4UU59_9MICO|nr:DUF732 domain-containing protein [Agromyces mariniharenae]TYL50477.1 DUF732 domain-containing protein [Agromyces mariniharenae]